MDFPRNILKALFYEIELDHVANAIVQKYKSDDFLFKKIVVYTYASFYKK